MKRALLAVAVGVLGALLWASVAGAAATGERKAAAGPVKVVKCANDAGKIVCPKGVTAIANDVAAWLKGYLAEASWSCGTGKKETASFELVWDTDETVAKLVGGDAAKEKLPACVKDRIVPTLLEEVPPMHFKAKTSDPNVDVRWDLKVSVTLAP